MSNVLEAAGRPEELGLAWLLVILLLRWWLSHREVRAPAGSIHLGPPQLVPLAVGQAAVAAQLLATTLTPWLSGNDPEAPK
jgi:hypothetical protein